MSEQVLTITPNKLEEEISSKPSVRLYWRFLLCSYILYQTAGFLFRVALVLNVLYHLFHILPHLYEVFV